VSKVVVTGAGGYVGGRLVEFLDADGWQVDTLEREYAPHLRVAQTVIDLADSGVTDRLSEALLGAETVVHLAGENEVCAASEPVGALMRTVAATQHIAAACAAARVRRLVYVSTVHVYGAQIAPMAILSEEMRVEPRSPYAIARLASEHAAAAAAPCELVVLRLTNCVGAPASPAVDRWSLVVNDLCRQGAVSGQLTLRTSGMQWRDFIPMTTVCSTIALAARASESRLRPSTYNLGSGTPSTVRAIAVMVQDAIEAQTGDRPRLYAQPPESNPPAAYYVAIDRLRAQGVDLSGDLGDAVSETVNFCLSNRHAVI
jgi:UDP-glucose 4-epimerase